MGEEGDMLASLHRHKTDSGNAAGEGQRVDRERGDPVLCAMNHERGHPQLLQRPLGAEGDPNIVFGAGKPLMKPVKGACGESDVQIEHLGLPEEALHRRGVANRTRHRFVESSQRLGLHPTCEEGEAGGSLDEMKPEWYPGRVWHAAGGNKDQASASVRMAQCESQGAGASSGYRNQDCACDTEPLQQRRNQVRLFRWRASRGQRRSQVTGPGECDDATFGIEGAFCEDGALVPASQGPVQGDDDWAAPEIGILDAAQPRGDLSRCDATQGCGVGWKKGCFQGMARPSAAFRCVASDVFYTSKFHRLRKLFAGMDRATPKQPMTNTATAKPEVAAPRSRDPLHGITLEAIVTRLAGEYGWAELARRIPIRCFQYDPSVKSSLTFLRKTPWARKKVEELFVALVR